MDAAGMDRGHFDTVTWLDIDADPAVIDQIPAGGATQTGAALAVTPQRVGVAAGVAVVGIVDGVGAEPAAGAAVGGIVDDIDTDPATVGQTLGGAPEIR